MLFTSIVTLLITLSDGDSQSDWISRVLSFVRGMANKFTDRRSDSMGGRIHSPSHIEEPVILDGGGSSDDDEQSTDRQIIDMALVDLDAHSITDSTCNLIDSNS